MSNIISYITCFSWLPMLLTGLLGALLGWWLFRGKPQLGDLSIQGEGQLRAEADGLRARINDLESGLGGRDTKISGLEAKLAAAATAGAAVTAVAASADGDDDESYALEWRNRYLAARVKYLEGRISEAPKKAAPKKKAPAKKKAVPKAKVVAKKAPAKKTIAKKAPAKKAVKKVDENKYWTNVKKYDGKAPQKTVDNIVKYCGISLRSRDASLVACSDEKELDRVIKNFCTKKLGMKTGQKELVAQVCKEMKAERFKSRVTFYYLCAKHARKMSMFK